MHRLLNSVRLFGTSPTWIVRLIAGFLLLAALGPGWHASGLSEWTWSLQVRGFSALCHQNPERSFFFMGLPMAVCARCFGFYVGLFSGSLGTFRTGKGRQWLVYIMVIIAVEIFIELIFGKNFGNTYHFISGFPLGFFVSVLIVGEKDRSSPAVANPQSAKA